MQLNNDYIGNSNLISNDEAVMAEILKERNLEHANLIAKKVYCKNTFYTKYGKRLLDFVIALAACIIFLPLNLIFAICTFLDVGSPILYKQSRCGKNGKEFVLVKFRNMNNKTDENGKLLPAEQRVTGFGRIMRKFSLDELLNFWSVLKGDMSIIGPRPLPMFFHDRMNERHKMREFVRPGLECPRMICPEGEGLSQYHIQFENDVWYVENISFLTDIKMCFRLVKMVFAMKMRDHQAKGEAASYFVGYDDKGHALSMKAAIKIYANNTDNVVI